MSTQNNSGLEFFFYTDSAVVCPDCPHYSPSFYTTMQVTVESALTIASTVVVFTLLKRLRVWQAGM